LALDRQRANRRRLAREMPVVDGEGVRLERNHETTADVVAANERAGHLWTAIESLPEKLRLVVVLAAIEGHDMHEVSALLDVPEGTVKSRLFLARQQLKERLSWMVTSSRT
jgi:RNA polymerase sigma-70 factor (ECF subfamily)